MRVILVDDEQLAIEVLTEMLSNYSDIEVVGSYTDPLLALEELKMTNPEVVFLDTKMGEVNGLKIAEDFMGHSGCEIVFVTAYSNYAVEAFEINAVDYLIKPVIQRRLSKTIGRLRARVNEELLLEANETSYDNKLIINSLGQLNVFDNNRVSICWRTKKTKEMFAYLWLHNGEVINKNLLMDIIFDDKNSERVTPLFHTTMYQLRKTLEIKGHKYCVTYTNEGYKLDMYLQSDYEEILILLNYHLLDEDAIEKILELYKGDLLETEGYLWVAGTAQRLKNMVFDRLFDFAKSKINSDEIDNVVEKTLTKISYMDDLNESVATMVIKMLGKKNRRGELEVYFNCFSERLRSELGVCPVAETLNLYNYYMGI